MQKQRIAILGGTFNPIHNGHIRLALACHNECAFDKILLIPANVPPHKQTPDPCSQDDRMKMCQIAVKGNPLFEVSDIEFRLGGTSYTVNTLHALVQLYPQTEFFLIVGSDMFFTFRQWKKYKEILQMATLVAASRNQKEHQKMLALRNSFLQEGFSVTVVDNQVYEVSSTQLRCALKSGQDVSDYLPAGVYQYIQMHHLFGGEEIAGFKNTGR